jgi:Caspase domain
MGKYVAVAIGVARAGNSLPELPGAVNGAKEFHDWAEKQGYEAHLVTDESDEVTVQTLKTEIRKIIDEGEAERLVIYFAGHGIQPSVSMPYWLLSRWAADSDEAVNFNLSTSNAKRSGIGQIAIFADACRSNAPDAASVGGSSIFPKATTSAGQLPQWDQFLASRLGESAQEVSATASTAAYGIFTRCVMRALSGSAQEEIIDRPPRVVTSTTLANYLDDQVPRESAETVGAAVQQPETVPGWRSPNDIYLRLPTASPAESQPKISEVLREGGHKAEAFRKPRDRKQRAEKKPQFSRRARHAVAKAERFNEKALKANEALFAASQEREGLTGHGLTLIGGEPVAVTVRRGEQASLFRENSKPNIRAEGEKPLSILIELDNGNWIAGCILPEFVGTIVIKDGLAASVNYAPARDSRFPRASFEHIAPMLNRWTALMHQGRFGDYQELTQTAGQLRKYNYLNPTLGIIAAYAYERTGNLHEIDSVAGYFAEAQQPVPFDVALLSTKPVWRMRQGLTIELDAGRRAVAGSFPLMTQGWSFLDREDEFVPLSLFEVRGGLLPALWTTFRGKEGKRLAELLHQGEV